MENYYEDQLNRIKALIEKKAYAEAQVLLDLELSQDYIPLNYEKEFHIFNDFLKGNKEEKDPYFSDMDSICQALLANPGLQNKALISLERMNLRNHLEALEDIFKNQAIDDLIKKQILVFLTEQEIKKDWSVFIEGGLHDLKSEDLKHPFQNNLYAKVRKELSEKYESNDPSFLKLLLLELDYQMIENFPLDKATINADLIVKKVKTYLHQNN